jgi:hypothetical protein
MMPFSFSVSPAGSADVADHSMAPVPPVAASAAR